MKTINLRDFYKSLYDRDQFCEVPDEVAELLLLYKRREEAQRRKIYRHKAQYSLDRNDGIENEALKSVPSADSVCEQQMEQTALFTAMKTLPVKQLKRLYAHFFLGMGYAEIAKQEGTDRSTVRRSIQSALAGLLKILQYF